MIEKILKEVAHEVREWAFGDESASSICHLCSLKVSDLLRARNIDAKIMLGRFMTDLSPEQSSGHFWVEADGFVIDVSGDQFDEDLKEPHPKVYVAPIADSPRYQEGKPITMNMEKGLRNDRHWEGADAP